MRRHAVTLNALPSNTDLRLVDACPLPVTAGQDTLSGHLQARPLGMDGAFQPAHFLAAVAVATNDLPELADRQPGDASYMLAPQALTGLDAACLNRVLDSLCAEVPPGVVLHDQPARWPDVA